MSLSKQLLALAFSGAALGYTFIPAVQAAIGPGPDGARPGSMLIEVQGKPKGKATCGTHMYSSAKEKKCMDARQKKSS